MKCGQSVGRFDETSCTCSMFLRQIHHPCKRLNHICGAHRYQITRMSASQANNETPRLLKVLCLHGYLQDAAIFKSRIGSMRKALKSRLEFVFIDAPFMASPSALQLASRSSQCPQLASEEATDESGTEAGSQGRSWWQWQDQGENGRPSRACTYSGWDVTREYLIEAIREHRPQGLLGFSQGAAAIGLLLSDLPADLGAGVARPSFAIMISGFLPRDERYRKLVLDSIPGDRPPCLIVYGTKDELVDKERSVELVHALGEGIDVYVHPGAHLVPTCSGAFKAKMIEFLGSYV
jgi:predicted esterase